MGARDPCPLKDPPPFYFWLHAPAIPYPCPCIFTLMLLADSVPRPPPTSDTQLISLFSLSPIIAYASSPPLVLACSVKHISAFIVAWANTAPIELRAASADPVVEGRATCEEKSLCAERGPPPEEKETEEGYPSLASRALHILHTLWPSTIH